MIVTIWHIGSDALHVHLSVQVTLNSLNQSRLDYLFHTFLETRELLTPRQMGEREKLLGGNSRRYRLLLFIFPLFFYDTHLCNDFPFS